MGKGLAKQAADKYPKLASSLGALIKRSGNIPHIVDYDNKTAIVSFPVKPIYLSVNTNEVSKFVVRHMIPMFAKSNRPTCIVPGWACKARMDIIELSIKKLVQLAQDKNWTNVVLPYIGCGAGELEAEVVVPLLERTLNENFTLVGLGSNS